MYNIVIDLIIPYRFLNDPIYVASKELTEILFLFRAMFSLFDILFLKFGRKMSGRKKSQ